MTKRNLVEYMSVFMDGDLYVVVETGMPEHSVQVGVGDSLMAAYLLLETTAVQSTGPDPVAAGLEWAASAGWISSSQLDEVEDAELF